MARAQKERATAAPTTTEAAVLALLAIEGERSGYDLAKQLGRAIGYVWAPAKSQLYVVLGRLVGAGLARRRHVAQSDRPDKQLYRIAPAGRKVLRAWLETVEPGNPEAFQLKLFVGGLADPETLAAQVRAFRRECEERLDELRAIEPTNTRRGHDFFHYLLLRRGIERYEHELRWCDWVLRELSKPAR